MAFTFDQVFAADPSNPSNVAQNAAITIFAPGDGTMTPIAITDPDGAPLANPITVNANGFASAFAHATLDRVAWAGGGFTGFFTSYEGMKAEATAAKVAAEAAADTAGADAAAVATAAIGTATDDAEAAAASAATAAAQALASATAATDAAALVGAPADTAIAAAINGAGSATEIALKTTYAKDSLAQPQGTVVLLGDSLTAANISGPSSESWALRGPWTWAAASLGKRLRVLKNAGISGQKTDQILARVQADVIDLNPGWCVVNGGTNDVKNAYTAATTKANLEAIYTKLREAGIRTVTFTIPPYSGWTAPEQANVFDINKWIMEYARTHAGIIVVDSHTPIADPSTGAPGTGKTYDGIHYTAEGAAAVGKRLAAALSVVVPPLDVLPISPVQPGILTGNPFMTGNTSGVATGWGVTRLNGAASSATKTKVARTDEVPGEWQQVTLAGSDVDAMVIRSVSTGFVAGDVVRLQAEFQTDANWASVTRFRLALRFRDAGYAVLLQPTDFSIVDATFPLAYRPTSGVLETPAIAIPTGTTLIECAVEFIGTGTFRVGRMALSKV